MSWTLPRRPKGHRLRIRSPASQVLLPRPKARQLSFKTSIAAADPCGRRARAPTHTEDTKKPPKTRGLFVYIRDSQTKRGSFVRSPTAEPVGFEPTVGSTPTQLFESCTFGRSDTVPRTILVQDSRSRLRPHQRPERMPRDRSAGKQRWNRAETPAGRANRPETPADRRGPRATETGARGRGPRATHPRAAGARASAQGRSIASP